jgi:cell wall-associated NlpC family hydrolase
MHNAGTTRLLRATLSALLVVAVAACSTTRPPGRTPGSTVDRLLSTAENLVGTRYCSAGATPDCFDCSGFTTHCFASVGVSLPRTSQQQFGVGTSVDRSNLQPGDLVFFRTNGRSISHVGIYAGDAQFIHSGTSTGVTRTPLQDRYWSPRYVGARRVVTRE